MQSKYGMVKTYRVFDEAGKVQDEIKLVFNAMTFIIYMNYTGRDLMADFTKLAISQAAKDLDKIRPEVVEDLQNGEFGNVTAEDLAVISNLTDTAETTMFILDFTVALMATARYPQRCDYQDMINEVPIGILYDSKFATDLFELLNFGLVDKKKQTKAK